MNHSALVKNLAKPGQDIINELTPEKAHLLHMAACIPEEAGEIYGAIKKHIFYNKPLTLEMRTKIINEMGDLEFYLEGLRQGLDLSREEVLEANINKLQKRYSEGSYSDAQANERADKEDEAK